MTMEVPADFGKDPASQVRRWLKELDLADRTENAWRQTGEKILKRYRAKALRKSSFNILWSNTETMAPALFNTPPSPDVRRRYRDEDPVGKVVAQMLERCLEFQTDTEQFMHAVKQDVLDVLLPGRGVSRVRYVPTLVPMDDQSPTEGYDQAGATPAADTKPSEGQGDVEPYEQVAWEQCEVEHVQWDDFRHGPGKTWAEVCWVAFRHRMTRTQVTELAGEEAAKAIAYDACQDETIDKDQTLKTVFGTTEVWEIWDKDDRKVCFVCRGYLQGFLKEIADPLRLIDFFPCPRPIYAIQDASTLVPTALFEQYKEQADELDRISMRINRIVDALKVRGVYDATVAEMAQLMSADDNKLIPTQNAALWLEKGGLEKAIYWMPIEQAASVLSVLYENREQSKQIVYELSGVADVRRGATDPNETLGAQRLKADFGNQRSSGLKLEIERYVRDLMRLMSEVVSDKFQPETLLRMSQMKIPTEAEVQQKVAQTQAQAAQQAQKDPNATPETVQQAVQQALQQLGERPVTLEQVLEVLKDDATRMFRIDVETDSMVSATAAEDMAGLRDVLSGVRDVMMAFAPAVEAGAMPAEAVKQIIMVVCRRAKMGSAVEDELDKIKQPEPKPDPSEAIAKQKAEAQMQSDQMKAQAAAQTAQIKAQSDAQIAQIQAQAQQQTDMVRQQAEAAQHQAKLDNEAQLAAIKQQFEDQDREREQVFLRWKAELEAATKIEVANISSKAKVANEATAAATREVSDEVQP